MSESHFDELREWSLRKHELVSKYLTGFVRILGGATQGIVYYVDGFAGPGVYGDHAEGSPIRAAKYAQTLLGRPYQLYCINVELDLENYQNLEQYTQLYQTFVTNRCGSFGDHVAGILKHVGSRPAIFFLDPFGIKGIEWEFVLPVLTRPHTTEILMRIDPTIISRLAGFADSQKRGSVAKRGRLTEFYGFSDESAWKQIWQEKGIDGLIGLYKRRLLEGMLQGEDRAYVGQYPIRSIDGESKYYLLFLTRHPMGGVLMSNIICGREECYERDVQEYQDRQPIKQLSLFDESLPTPEAIFEYQVERLKQDIWEKFQGKQASRIDIHGAMLERWFGRIKDTHLTKALKQMEEEGRIVHRTGAPSGKYTKFLFKDRL